MAFQPATRGQGGLAGNLAALESYDRIFDNVVGWQAKVYTYDESNFRRQKRLAPDVLHTSWSTVLVYALALAVLPVVTWRARRRRSSVSTNTWVLAAMSATVWFAFFIDNALDVGENARRRFETDPIVWVLAAFAVTALVRQRARGRRGRDSAGGACRHRLRSHARGGDRTPRASHRMNS
jgi:hypothetical protein